MFLVNSRLGQFTATPLDFHREGGRPPGHPFFRSYGAILPSSLTRDHSSALGFSPCLPVSVCGTVTDGLTRGFSRQHGVSKFVCPKTHFLAALRVNGVPDLPGTPSLCHDRSLPPYRMLILLRYPIVSLSPVSGAGMLTCYPSPTPFGLDLGAD